MGNSRKDRVVNSPPFVVYFKPQGMPIAHLEVVEIGVDEYEAIRLADYEGLKHEDAAIKMDISRPTFTRLLENAHKKIAEAIISGKAIRIEGGRFKFRKNGYYCVECDNRWEIDFDSPIPEECPSCKSHRIMDLGDRFGWRRRRGRGRF